MKIQAGIQVSRPRELTRQLQLWKRFGRLYLIVFILVRNIILCINVYCKTTTAKELWESLERKYKTEDAGTKKFVVARFLDYKMVDSKSVVSQVQDLQVLLHDIHAEGMTLSETFQVAAIIEKLPPSWVEFKNYLKHTKGDDVEDLVFVHAGSSSRFNSKGNKKDKRKNDKKGKGKSEYLAPKAGIMKQKFQGTCYNCDQPGHRAANCKMPKRVNPRQANMVLTTAVGGLILGQLVMCVLIRMTSEKELKLTNVLYVLDIRKNLVSGWLLNKFGFCLVFESDKFVLSKNQMHVSKDYVVNVVRSDRGGEYMSPFAKLCAKHGIRHEFTAPYSEEPYLERNSKCHVDKFWFEPGHVGEAILTATYLLNKIPPKVAVPKPKAQKIGPKSVDCIFIGYAKKKQYSRDYGLAYDRHPAVIKGYSDVKLDI
ncbi:pol polyprotein [Tanacetum coccineum]